MRSIRLRCIADLELGGVGLVISTLPPMPGQITVATDGVLIAHDLLEHQNGVGHIGTIIDEMEAMGGLWFVRGSSGVLRRESSAYSVEESIAAEFTRMFRDYYYGAYIPQYVLNTPPVTQLCDADDAIDCVMEEADYKAEFTPDDIDSTWVSQRNAFHALIRPYMRIGYRKAKRRFGTWMKANDQFWAITDAVERYCKHGEDGMKCLLRYGDGQATCQEYWDDR